MQVEKQKSMTDAQVEEAARLFAVLSEPSRLYLLRALMEKALTVGELVEATGMKQGNVSKHLGMLYQSGFISRRQEGNFVHYAITDLRLKKLCELMCSRIEDDVRRRAALFLR